MIVVDASLAVEVLLVTPLGEAAAQQLFSAGRPLCAPHLLDVEVAQVMRRYERIGDISAGRGAAALRDLADFPVARYPHEFLLPRIWATRHNLTAYDAAYVTLAGVLDATLWTCDRKLAGAPALPAAVRLIH